MEEKKRSVKAVRLIAPDDCSSGAIGDFKFKVGSDRKVLIPADMDYSSLLDHGFKPDSLRDMLPLKLAEQERIAAENQEKHQKFLDSVQKGNALFGRSESEEVPIAYGQPEESEEQGPDHPFPEEGEEQEEIEESAETPDPPAKKSKSMPRKRSR